MSDRKLQSTNTYMLNSKSTECGILWYSQDMHVCKTHTEHTHAHTHAHTHTHTHTHTQTCTHTHTHTHTHTDTQTHTHTHTHTHKHAHTHTHTHTHTHRHTDTHTQTHTHTHTHTCTHSGAYNCSILLGSGPSGPQTLSPTCGRPHPTQHACTQYMEQGALTTVMTVA